MTKDQTTKGLHFVIIGLLIGITGLVVFNAQLGILKWITNYSVQIMLGMLALGFIFYTCAQERLMFTSFICCSLLCLFLQRSTNVNLVLPEYSAGSVLKIAHANLTNVDDDLELALQEIYSLNADLVSLQEVNFQLNERIEEIFGDKYPYRSSPMKKNDFWSIYVFSKVPMTSLDTFYVGDIPNLHGTISMEQDGPPIQFISSYILPPFSDQLGNDAFQKHLDEIASFRDSTTIPYFVFGDFNVAGWYDEIHDFREQAALMDSRRGYMPAVSNPFSFPVDHIFFSEQLKCVDFDIIKTPASTSIGIVGTYQLNDTYLSGLEE